MFTNYYIFFHIDRSNALLRDLKLLKLHDILESDFFIYSFKFSSIELPELACCQFNPVHEVLHTRDTRKKFVNFCS